MSLTKRRLSVNKGAGLPVHEIIEDDDICDFDSIASPIAATKKLKNRRRSSIMGNGKAIMNPQEQLRIAEMYKTVIQLSSENVSAILSIPQTICYLI